MNVKFHKITSYTWNFQNFTCIFTILVKFDIPFLGLWWEIFFGITTEFFLFLICCQVFFIIILIDVLQQLQKNKIEWRKNGEKIK